MTPNRAIEIQRLREYLASVIPNAAFMQVNIIYADDDYNIPEYLVCDNVPEYVVYCRNSSRAIESEDCPICYEEMNARNCVIVSPPCHHQFHHSCLKTWYVQKQTCPMCRLNFDTVCHV